MHGSKFFPKVSTKVKKKKISIASVQCATQNSCLCCSVLWQMSSQILAGSEKVDNKAASILEDKMSIFCKLN